MKDNLGSSSQRKASKKKVSLIYLTYNKPDLDKKYFPSVMAQDFPSLEVLFVDNGSHKGTSSIAWVKRRFPSVKVISIPKNLGFVGGNNYAVASCSGDYIAFVSNDLELEPGFITACVKAMNSDEMVGMVSTRMLYSKEKGGVDNVGVILLKNTLPKSLKEPLLHPFCPCGGAMMYKRSVLDEIRIGESEYFDKDYFAYDEDFDMGMRARLLGYHCVHADDALCYHEHGATFQQSDFSIYLADRNRIWTFVKNYPLWVLLLKLPIFLLIQCGSCLKYTFKLKPHLIIKSKLHALFGMGNMLKKRKIIQKKRKITAKEFLRLMR